MFTALLLAASLHNPVDIDIKRLDTIVRSYVSHRQFSGSVLIARNGKVLFDRAYGMANWDWRKANTPLTKYRLGSITKQFTAAGVLLLEERGKLRLDDSITIYFPEAPSAWKAITILHLLHHESGIPDIVNLPDYKEFERQTHSKEQLLKRFADLPLRFEPGTKHRYSNSGYILLGQLIERVAGESYENFLKKNLFTVVGMDDTGCDSTTSVVSGRATGYVAASEGGLVPATYIDMSVPFGAGNLYSTTHDLLRWEQALFSGKILRSSSLSKMLAPFQDITPSKSGIGMGLEIGETYGRKQIFFGGGIEGFNSWLAYDPADKTVVVALSNVNTTWLEDLSGQLSLVFHGQKVVLTAERKEIPLKEEAMQRFVGAYVVSPTMNLNIGIESGKLYVQADGQGRLTLYPESKTRFFLKDLDAQGEFVSNDRGSWDLLWHQTGTTIRAPRK